MKHGSLFSGIGGFDLAAQWMAWDNVFHVEKEPFPRQVLKYYWPKAHSYKDIKKTDFTKYKHAIDILSGGFPCQPFSNAGKRLGTEDDRNLWPEMFRAVRETSPSYVVAENVPGLLNWGEGVVFQQIYTDLENEGYEVQSLLLPASGIGAPHRRYRLWIVAYSNHNRCRIGESEQIEESKCKGTPDTGQSCKNATTTNAKSKYDSIAEREKKKRQRRKFRDSTKSDFTANSNSSRRQKQHIRKEPSREGFFTRIRNSGAASDTVSLGQWREANRKGKAKQFDQNSTESFWNNFPTESPICGRNDGLSSKLDGITLSKFRRESIKAFGNAIVPQLAYQIFKSIQETENEYI